MGKMVYEGRSQTGDVSEALKAAIEAAVAGERSPKVDWELKTLTGTAALNQYPIKVFIEVK